MTQKQITYGVIALIVAVFAGIGYYEYKKPAATVPSDTTANTQDSLSTTQKVFYQVSQCKALCVCLNPTNF